MGGDWPMSTIPISHIIALSRNITAFGDIRAAVGELASYTAHPRISSPRTHNLAFVSSGFSAWRLAWDAFLSIWRIPYHPISPARAMVCPSYPFGGDRLFLSQLPECIAVFVCICDGEFPRGRRRRPLRLVHLLSVRSLFLWFVGRASAPVGLTAPLVEIRWIYQPAMEGFVRIVRFLLRTPVLHLQMRLACSLRSVWVGFCLPRISGFDCRQGYFLPRSFAEFK